MTSIVTGGTTTIYLTPLAMARISNDLFLMAKGYDSGSRADYARNYVLCASIEIGLKSAILADECSEDRKKEIKSLGHDLLKALARYETIYGSTLWDAKDRTAIEAINQFFRNKGLEYFTSDMLFEAVSGGKNLPDTADVEAAAERVNAFLNQRKFFRDL